MTINRDNVELTTAVGWIQGCWLNTVNSVHTLAVRGTFCHPGPEPSPEVGPDPDLNALVCDEGGRLRGRQLGHGGRAW